jgi:hypothetical protein
MISLFFNCMKRSWLWQLRPSSLALVDLGMDEMDPPLRTHSFHSGHACPGLLLIDNPCTTNDSFLIASFKVKLDVLE